MPIGFTSFVESRVASQDKITHQNHFF